MKESRETYAAALLRRLQNVSKTDLLLNSQIGPDRFDDVQLNAMKSLRLLAQRAGRELARHPEAWGTAQEVPAAGS